jgi:hypothetical protein
LRKEGRSSLPLSRRARIEIYLPTRNKAAYKRLRRAFEYEFLNTFGGCTAILGIRGIFLSVDGSTDFDEIDLVYADTPFDLKENFSALSKYTDDLKAAVLEVTAEESVLVVVQEVHHSV